MPKYKVVAERTFTIDYEVTVEAESEEAARILVEQCNEDIDEWENDVAYLEGVDERTPKVIEIERDTFNDFNRMNHPRPSEGQLNA
tara:strand:+ start:185 stop:442 length:258 start_codon:yes stop_codon:yes gene_type:complete